MRTIQLRKAGLFSQDIAGNVCILPVATPVHQQLEILLKYTWSGSVRYFSSGLGEGRSTVEISFIWGNLTVSVFTERTFVLQVLFKAPKIAGFQPKPHNNPASIGRDLPHVPDCSLHANLPIYFSHRLLGPEKRSSQTCSGLQNP